MERLALPSGFLLLPLLLFGAAIGYRRSLGRETVTGLCLAAVLLAFERLVALALSIARLGARLVSEAAGAAGASAPRLERTVDRLPRTGVLLASAALFILAAYWLGGRFGRDGGARLYRLGGAALGALNALLVLSVASAAAREAFGPARLRTLLLVPGSARGLDVRIPPLPSAATLSQWSLYAVLVLALLACWWAATTLLPRLRR